MAGSAGRQNERRTRAISRRLVEMHPPARKVRRDPLDELVLTILSQNTSDANCYRGWSALRARYPEWPSVLAAPDGELEETIRPAGLAKQKAGTIRRVLSRLRDEHGEPSLEHVRAMDDRQALDYLTSFPGVGVKTAACVLCFSLGRDVIPVDTHVHRLAIRLQLVPERASAAQTHEILNREVPPGLRYGLHVSLVAHGRRICGARRPRCGGCVLDDLCPRVGVDG